MSWTGSMCRVPGNWHLYKNQTLKLLSYSNQFYTNQIRPMRFCFRYSSCSFKGPVRAAKMSFLKAITTKKLTTIIKYYIRIPETYISQPTVHSCPAGSSQVHHFAYFRASRWKLSAPSFYGCSDSGRTPGQNGCEKYPYKHTDKDSIWSWAGTFGLSTCQASEKAKWRYSNNLPDGTHVMLQQERAL